ncbi:MAG: hypothetical protein N2171_08020, partial [Clostridia bacterium]|nr:hypothetical protein [Clostridia bacterium]
MKVKRLLAGAVSAALLAVNFAIPAVAETTSWKFDFGSADDVADGYIAVPADTNQITTGTYGFLGIDGYGSKLSDRLDSFSMTGSQKIELTNGRTNASSAPYNDSVGSTVANYPTRFALKVNNGTYYRVTATVGGVDPSKAANVTLFSEKRHPIISQKVIPAGETYTVNFSVDVETVYYEKSSPVGNYVDDLLNVVVVGDNSALVSLEIVKVPEKGTTLWVLGDSTVCDQSSAIPYFPLQNYAGVGQALSKYVPSTVAVSNHGEGGLSAWDNNHLANVSANIKAGDYMYVEYGHNHKTDGTAGYLSCLLYTS